MNVIIEQSSLHDYDQSWTTAIVSSSLRFLLEADSIVMKHFEHPKNICDFFCFERHNFTTYNFIDNSGGLTRTKLSPRERMFPWNDQSSRPPGYEATTKLVYSFSFFCSSRPPSTKSSKAWRVARTFKDSRVSTAFRFVSLSMHVVDRSTSESCLALLNCFVDIYYSWAFRKRESSVHLWLLSLGVKESTWIWH